MEIVPLQPVPNQTLQVQLAGQPVVLDVYQTAYGLFMNVFVGSRLIVAGVLCLNKNLIVRDAYLGLIGDFAFSDQQGNSDPIYMGLGSQFLLGYLDTTDLAAGEA